jgi:hypothetical protein
MDNNFFKEMYLFELNRKDQLAENINSLITILAIIGGLLGYLIQDYHFFDNIPSLLFIFFFCLALLLYGIAIYHTIIYFYPPVGYEGIPISSELISYYNELVAYYNKYPNAEGDAASFFTSYLDGKYIQATDLNSGINDYRAECQRKAFQKLSVTVVFAFISAFPHFFQQAINITPNIISSTNQEIKK